MFSQLFTRVFAGAAASAAVSSSNGYSPSTAFNEQLPRYNH